MLFRILLNCILGRLGVDAGPASASKRVHSLNPVDDGSMETMNSFATFREPRRCDQVWSFRPTEQHKTQKGNSVKDSLLKILLNANLIFFGIWVLSAR